MTATHVDGRKVIADEAAMSPHLHDLAGNPVMWKQIRKLLLDDGSEVWGCVHCDYTNSNILSIRPHLNAHSTKPRRARANNSDRDASPVADWVRLLRQIEQLDKVCAERDEWKQRAQTAERALATLRRALSGTGR